MSRIKLIIFILKHRRIKWIKKQRYYYKKDKTLREECHNMTFFEYLDWALHNEPCGA